MFDGFAELREAFAFPRKYLGFQLTGLAAAWRRIHGPKCRWCWSLRRRDEALATRLSRTLSF